MSVTVNAVDGHKVTLNIEVPAKEFSKHINQAVKRIANQVNINGFRKGKAPRFILERNFGPQVVIDEAFEITANKAYNDALREQDLTPVTDPEIERVTVEEGKDVVFTATFTKRPDVVLGDYKGLEVEKGDATISEEAVSVQLENIRAQKAEMVVAEKGEKLATGDFAVIDFAGFVDGQPFDGGEGKSYPLEIGSGSFIPGFEDQLIGAAAGDDVTVNVMFPETYFVEALAGKEAKFDVHVHDIKRKVLPELDDDFAKSASAYETIGELKADLRAKLEEDAIRRVNDEYNAALIQKAVANATVDIPEVMVDARVEQMLQEMDMNLQSRGLNLENYLTFSKKTLDDLRAENRETAAANVRADLVLEDIGKAENIQVTPDDMNFEIYTMAQNFGANPQEVWDIIAKEGRVSMLAGTVVRKKAARIIIESAKGIEATDASAAEEAAAE